MLSRNRSIGLMLALAVTGMGLTAPAAVINWTKDGLGLWTNTANWGNSSVPTSGDEAVLNKTLTFDRGILVDSGRGIGTITFNNTSVYKYDLNNGSLLLDNGGLIRTAATNGNHTDTITTSTITIQGDAGSATFTAGATSASSILSISSGITGISSGANITTLTLNGTNTGLNALTGVIGNGASGGKLALVKSGTGTWSLSNAGNTFSGGVTLNTGTLIATATGTLGTGLVTLAGGMITNSSGTVGTTFTNDLAITASMSIIAPTYNSSVVFSGTNQSIVGTPTITVGGSSSLRGVSFTTNPMQLLSNAAFTGAVGSTTPQVLFSGGFDLKNGNRQLTFDATTTNTIGGALSDTAGTNHTLTLAGTGTVTINAMSAFNNGSGLVIDGITAKANAGTVFPDFVTLKSGTLDLNNNDLILPGLLAATVGGNVNNTGTARILTLNGSGSYSYAGTINPTTPARISLTKSGTGTQILSGVNTYAGATRVEGGKLTIAVGGTINGTSGITIAGGEFNYNSSTALTPGITFSGTGGKLTGTGTIGSAITISSGNTVSPGNSPGIQNVGDFTMNTGANYDWEYQGNVSPQFDQYKLAAGKTLNLAGKWTLNLYNLDGIPVADLATRYYIFDTTGASLTGLGVVGGSDVQLMLGTHYTINYGTSGYGNVRVYADADGIGTDGIYIIHVPEPTSLSLLGLGAAGLLLRRRRKV